ncbi:MAG: retropepsin-like domain-containing protein [Tannerellaceae bacterium]|nr:retropepsin-like domain-containing protein [Tannerellaceae bacterium]
MKKFIFTLCIFCSSFLLCQGNLTEQIVLKFISERRWIELREYYDKNKNNITGYENLAAEAYIYTYTNQPAKAIDVTNQIITEFGESMGSNCIEWYGLNLNNYIEIQNYKKASDICDILFHLADKFELGDEMKAVFLYLKDEMNTFDLQPKTYLTNPSPEQDILLDLIADPKTEGLNFEVISNETKLKAIFDTGATECFINQQLASSIGVKYASHDTIMVNNKELKAKKRNDR